MTDIRAYISANLLEPLKQYPTVIQDTMIEIIAQKLQRLYEYTVKFPEIVSPNRNRIDILRAIADQFLFTVREDADIQEQIDILDNILYVYSKRGSIDTIENMWKYYGGSLPNDVKVIIPSYNLFRYSVSRLSGNHTFINSSLDYIELDTPIPEDIKSQTLLRIVANARDILIRRDANKGDSILHLANVEGLKKGDEVSILDINYRAAIVDVIKNTTTPNRPGVYEVRLTNNRYPIPDLKEFMINELVAAGSQIYFSNALNLNMTELGNPGSPDLYRYNVLEDTFLHIQMMALKSSQGLSLSGMNGLNSEFALWSGKSAIFLELSKVLELAENNPNLSAIVLNTYKSYNNFRFATERVFPAIRAEYDITITAKLDIVQIAYYLYCTPTNNSIIINRNKYNRQGEFLESEYPGYFVLGETLLGEVF